jgi:uncharacterized protein YjbI with pentapeptide repeats
VSHPHELQNTSRCAFGSYYSKIGGLPQQNEPAQESYYSCPFQRIEWENGKKSLFCLFHDPHYVGIRDVERDLRVASGFYQMVDNAVSSANEFLCIGFRLPGFVINKTFPNKVYFQNAIFYGSVDFSNSTFLSGVSFMGARFEANTSFFNVTFEKEAIFQGVRFESTAYFGMSELLGGADFSKAEFKGDTIFDFSKFCRSVNFSSCKILNGMTFISSDFDELDNLPFVKVYLKEPQHVDFEPKGGRLSRVAFVGTDVSRIKFGENARFGDDEREKFKIFQERLLETELTKDVAIFGRKIPMKKATGSFSLDYPLGLALSVYRNLRENYEFRMGYDEAGELFIREMEMKRNYKAQWDEASKDYIYSLQPWLVRNFSLTGLYYNLSKYGQSILRPTLFGIVVIALSTILWLTQPDHSLDFSAGEILVSQDENYTLAHFEDSFERSILNFIPLLPADEGIRLGMMDYLFKIVGRAVTFGLIIIALRRKFERKFRH